jgi:hypothetical protein
MFWFGSVCRPSLIYPCFPSTVRSVFDPGTDEELAVGKARAKAYVTVMHQVVLCVRSVRDMFGQEKRVRASRRSGVKRVARFGPGANVDPPVLP